MYTGEEIRAIGHNPDTVSSIGGKYRLDQFGGGNSGGGGTPQPTANTYNPTQLGINPPAGGFQTGGWYAGRQYWNGTLSAPGVIHPASNQQGAGQAVSKEVVQQTNPDNWAYIQQQANQQGTATASNNAGTAGTTGTSGLSGMAPTNTSFNLPEIYKSLFESSGITELEQGLAEKEKAFTEAKGKINDNPYLSEATRVGRVAKLEQLHADRTKNERDEIAVKRADVEMQLNLQTKQFDINSQMAKDSLDRFNTLLSAGALDNVGGDTIAQLTQMTGISSDMIYSAINAQKKKNQETQVITSTNDSGEVTVSVIDPKTGNVISQKSLGTIGNAQGGAGGMATKDYQKSFVEDVPKTQAYSDESGNWRGIFPQLVVKYARLLSLDEIYRAYASAGMTTPGEDPAEINDLYLTARGE